MQEQWNTFERVENYNDLIYQKFEEGLRGNMYYVFRSDAEFKDYRAGQQLHVITYPSLPPTTFDPISQRPMPNVVPKEAPPYETNAPRLINNKVTPTASELAAQTSDLEIYTYVSSYNAVHQLKYQFVDDDEKQAYRRAALRVLAMVSTDEIQFLP
jgi:hypothetical protein